VQIVILGYAEKVPIISYWSFRKMKAANLRSMTVEALIETRKQIDKLLATKVASAKKELQDKLSYLEGVFANGRRRGRKPRSAVAAKYRGPNGETWAGRGMRPRWLTALVNSGHRIEEFAVEGAGQASASGKRGPGRRKGPSRRKGKTRSR
jgi:DNA-binding protein H-NS